MMSLRRLFLFSVLMLVPGALFAWTGPRATPPDRNADAPINVSGQGQLKKGGVTLGELLSPIDTGLRVIGGKVGIGSVFRNQEPTTALHVSGTVMADCFMYPATTGCLSGGAAGARGPAGAVGPDGLSSNIWGYGVPNRIPLWEDSTHLGISLLTQALTANGEVVGVSNGADTSFFTQLFNVNGNIKVRGICFPRASGGDDCKFDWASVGNGLPGTAGAIGATGGTGGTGATGSTGSDGIDGSSGENFWQMLVGGSIGNRNPDDNANPDSGISVIGKVSTHGPRRAFCFGLDCISGWRDLQTKNIGITELSAGPGVTLSPNPITADGSGKGTISADSRTIIKSVGLCADGSVLQGIDDTGAPKCVQKIQCTGADCPPPPPSVAGGGTPSYLPKWTGGNILGNSIVREFTGADSNSPSSLNVLGSLDVNSKGGISVHHDGTKSLARGVTAGVKGDDAAALLGSAEGRNSIGVWGEGNGATSRGAFLRGNNGARALETVGPLSLTGIGEADKKVLASDAGGNASWKSLEELQGDTDPDRAGSSCDLNGDGEVSSADIRIMINVLSGQRRPTAAEAREADVDDDDRITQDDLGACQFLQSGDARYEAVRKVHTAYGARMQDSRSKPAVLYVDEGLGVGIERPAAKLDVLGKAGAIAGKFTAPDEKSVAIAAIGPVKIVSVNGAERFIGTVIPEVLIDNGPVLTPIVKTPMPANLGFVVEAGSNCPQSTQLLGSIMLSNNGIKHSLQGWPDEDTLYVCRPKDGTFPSTWEEDNYLYARSLLTLFDSTKTTCEQSGDDARGFVWRGDLFTDGAGRKVGACHPGNDGRTSKTLPAPANMGFVAMAGRTGDTGNGTPANCPSGWPELTQLKEYRGPTFVGMLAAPQTFKVCRPPQGFTVATAEKKSPSLLAGIADAWDWLTSWFTGGSSPATAITSSSDLLLDVGGKVRIADGSQGVNKILTAAADGTATWKTKEELGLGGVTPPTPSCTNPTTITSEQNVWMPLKTLAIIGTGRPDPTSGTLTIDTSNGDVPSAAILYVEQGGQASRGGWVAWQAEGGPTLSTMVKFAGFEAGNPNAAGDWHQSVVPVDANGRFVYKMTGNGGGDVGLVIQQIGYVKKETFSVCGSGPASTPTATVPPTVVTTPAAPRWETVFSATYRNAFFVYDKSVAPTTLTTFDSRYDYKLILDTSRFVRASQFEGGNGYLSSSYEFLCPQISNAGAVLRCSIDAGVVSSTILGASSSSGVNTVAVVGIGEAPLYGSVAGRAGYFNVLIPSTFESAFDNLSPITLQRRLK